MPIFLRLLLVLAAFAVPGTAAHADESGPLSASDVKIYRGAFAAAQEGHWEEARALAARGQDPLAAKIIRWLDLVGWHADHSFAELSAFLEANPKWPRRIRLLAEAERAMPDDLDPDFVLQWFGDRPPLTVEGSIQQGRAMIATGLEAQAVPLLRRDWVRLDMDRGEEREFLARFGQYLRREDHVARLDRLLWDGEESSARRMLDRVDAGHRRLAEARLRLMNMDPGVDAAVARVPPELARDPGLVYERARWRRRHGLDEAVVELFDPPLSNISHPDRLWAEAENAARLALDRGDISVAYRLAKHHGATEGLTFAEGEWLAGWIALRFLRDYQVAYDHFTRLYAGVNSAVSQGRGAYWAGRAAEAMGDIATARNWYKTAAANLTTFYGQLAADRLGQDKAMRFAPPPEPTDEDRAAFAERELVRAVQILGQLDEPDEARSFLIQLGETAETPAEYRMVADLAEEVDRVDLAVRTAREARQAGVELVEYLYPLRHLPDGIAPEEALVLAIMRQESGFATDAVSPAGARGLMQLMPATAKHMARRLDLRYSKALLTSDPELNIRLGSSYLDLLLHRFGGSYLLAIAAYNAGPSNVLEWLRVYGDPREPGIDPVDWIEMIPFSETRNYVQRVLETLQVYRHRLGEPMLAVTLAEDITGRAEY